MRTKDTGKRAGIARSISWVKRAITVAAVCCLACPPVLAQFGGRPGDAVFYMVTTKGSGDFQTVPRSTGNTAEALARFKVTDSNTVEQVQALPFPLFRKVLYETDDELFQVGIDYEPTVGLHRVFRVPIKFFVMTGSNLPIPEGRALGNMNNYLKVPKGIDFKDDLAMEDLAGLTWAPTRWPFMVLTDHRGDFGDPNLSGFEVLFQLPDGISLPALMPWTNVWRVYPGKGWPDGVDQKILDVDPTIISGGLTTRMLRVRPGKRTPTFRMAGHTHLYVLQGGAQIVLPNGTTVALKKDHYAYLPAGFVFTVANPRAYEGPVMPRTLAEY